MDLLLRPFLCRVQLLRGCMLVQDLLIQPTYFYELHDRKEDAPPPATTGDPFNELS